MRARKDTLTKSQSLFTYKLCYFARELPRRCVQLTGFPFTKVLKFSRTMRIDRYLWYQENAFLTAPHMTTRFIQNQNNMRNLKTEIIQNVNRHFENIHSWNCKTRRKQSNSHVSHFTYDFEVSIHTHVQIMLNE